MSIVALVFPTVFLRFLYMRDSILALLMLNAVLKLNLDDIKFLLWRDQPDSQDFKNQLQGERQKYLKMFAELKNDTNISFLLENVFACEKQVEDLENILSKKFYFLPSSNRLKSLISDQKLQCAKLYEHIFNQMLISSEKCAKDLFDASEKLNTFNIKLSLFLGTTIPDWFKLNVLGLAPENLSIYYTYKLQSSRDYFSGCDNLDRFLENAKYIYFESYATKCYAYCQENLNSLNKIIKESSLQHLFGIDTMQKGIAKWYHLYIAVSLIGVAKILKIAFDYWPETSPGNHPVQAIGPYQIQFDEVFPGSISVQVEDADLLNVTVTVGVAEPA
jgi:hypothetical protein